MNPIEEAKLRDAECCDNCKHCEDSRFNENEVLECYALDMFISYGLVCDLYEPR